MDHEPEVVNAWAPEVFYDEEMERYIIIIQFNDQISLPSGQKHGTIKK